MPDAYLPLGARVRLRHDIVLQEDGCFYVFASAGEEATVIPRETPAARLWQVYVAMDDGGRVGCPMDQVERIPGRALVRTDGVRYTWFADVEDCGEICECEATGEHAHPDCSECGRPLTHRHSSLWCPACRVAVHGWPRQSERDLLREAEEHIAHLQRQVRAGDDVRGLASRLVDVLRAHHQHAGRPGVEMTDDDGPALDLGVEYGDSSLSEWTEAMLDEAYQFGFAAFYLSGPAVLFVGVPDA